MATRGICWIDKIYLQYFKYDFLEFSLKILLCDYLT